MNDPQSRAALRVLILNWRDTGHPDGGGSEVYAERVADGLASRGHQVTLLTARYAGSPSVETRPSGVLVRRAGGRFGVYLHAALAVRLRRVPRPDIIIETQNGLPFLAALWAPRTPHIMLVHHVHREQWPVLFAAPLARVGWWVESRVAPWVNRRRQYVTVSERSRSELAEIGVDPARVQVIHNGVLPPPPHDTMRTTYPQLLVLGRLVPHKRVEIAITVAERLREDFPGLRLVVAGRGWWEDELRREVAERRLDGLVELAGYVDEDQRHRLYASSWVSLVPSIKEGWGLVVVEAGLHETPSVAFDGAGGVTESIIDGTTGLLARGEDIEHFTELTRALLLDAGLRATMGFEAAAFARQFTWAQTVERFDALITAVVGGGPVPSADSTTVREPVLD